MKILILIKSFIAVIMMVIAVLVLAPAVIISHYLIGHRGIEDFILRLWGRIVCFFSGVRVRMHGTENIPQGGALLLFNHSSFFDIFALSASVNGLRFGAKAELFKIPIFAHAMKASGNLPIARDNRNEVIRIYEDAKKRFASGEKFALSPEGGRYYNPDALSKFKSGPFIFAISAAAPIVPVVILGAYEALPKGQFLFNSKHWSSYIDLHFLPAIDTSNMHYDDRHQLAEQVYRQMNEIWQKRIRH